MTDIAIIGAGAAGIAAARRLAELKQDYLLLEAKDVIGGRCVTDTQTLGAPVDLGAHWLHSPALNPLKGFADQLGIQHGVALEGRYSRNGAWLSAADQTACTDYVDACFERVVQATAGGKDIAVADLFADVAPSPWHDVFLAELQAKQGVAPKDCSALDLARYVWEGDDLPVIGGYGTLLTQLAQGLALRCATPVTRIDWSGRRHIQITTPAGTLAVQRVILTVSTALLARGIDFHPLLPAWKQDAIANLPLGSCNKVALRFAESALGDCPPSLIMPLRGTESVELVVREGGLDIATCLFNGPVSRDLALAGPAAMADYALERLVEIFGHALRTAVLPQRVTVDWDKDHYIGGCFSAARAGHADARMALARDVDNRLFFAGEATSPDFIGDVHGAWFSGITAAEAAATALKGKSI
nr:NAD(P)/FAD-dependent oxidoreductase [uncultured Dongia sp.]